MAFTLTNNSAVWCQDPPVYTEMSIAAAAGAGYMNGYCYIFDGTQNQPVGPNSDLYIPPWTGFWVIVKEELDLLIPKQITHPPALGNRTKTKDITYTEETNKNYYFIAFPLVPADSRDIDDNIAGDPGELVSGEHDSKNVEYSPNWRVAKWNYNSGNYDLYTGSGSLAEIQPGRGYFLQHIYGTDEKIISVSGYEFAPVDEYYKLRLPEREGDTYTYHMCGNPYYYDIRWMDCKVAVPMTDVLPLPKPAVMAQEEIEKWHIGLKLESYDGKARDTYNRAGVVVTSGFNPDRDCAFDLIQPGDFIRLAVKDPSNPDRVPYAYDYRAPNQDEYKWQVELTTTYADINTKFKLDNFDSVPENYVITMRENKSGEVYEINEDKTIDIALASGETETFILTATRIQSVVKEEEIIPEAFGITDIRPNPFNPSTTISYFLDRPGNVTVTIFNVNGQLIETIVDGYSDPGYHNVMWNAKYNATGIYGVSVVSDERRDFRKITLIK